jgi:hypothetical protein
MNHGASLVLSTAFGLLTGIGHGLYAHQHNLPLSLSEQVVQAISIDFSGQE